jgi:O-acetyl-ADP-ribose deacetylase (regulator of RNase III)
MRKGGYVHGFEIDANHSLHIYQGSLVRVEAHALVSSDDNYLTAGGGVSGALARVAGFEVERERQELVWGQSRPTIGDVVRTSGGNLPCRYLYHAITIDFDLNTYMDEVALRRLIANLLSQATEDGVRSIGLPAIGTGAAYFEIGRAAEIIIDELLVRLVNTPIKRVVLALMGDEAERLFYERLVRSQAERLASAELRRRESAGFAAAISKELTRRLGRGGMGTANVLFTPDGEAAVVDSGLARPAGPVVEQSADPASREEQDGPIAPGGQVDRPTAVVGPVPPAPSLAGSVGGGDAAIEVIEQFPNLIDECRLSATPSDRPRLVDGLAELIMRQADPDEIDRELLNSPVCRTLRGTLKQRLKEFLYLSEINLRKALGPALFKNKDLRQMLNELGEDSDVPRDQDQLIGAILRALCFNTLEPPTGIAEYISRLDQILAALRVAPDERTSSVAALEAGKILEQALKDLLRMYGFLFFGNDFEGELVSRKVVPPRRDGHNLSRLTIGQALEALDQLNSLVMRDDGLRAKWKSLERSADELMPRTIAAGPAGQSSDSRQVLRQIIAARNDSVHTGAIEGSGEPDEMVGKIQRLHAFFCTCQASGIYPDVLRYEGTYENRNGERFVYFLDEKERERKVRTDERIDPRRHYYCFATNNPVHLYPTLVPKLH